MKLKILIMFFVAMVIYGQPYQDSWNTYLLGEELMTNGTFEDGFTAGVADGWALSRGNATEVAGYSGGSAQNITNPAGNTALIKDDLTSTKGTLYLLVFYAKNSKGSGGEIRNNNGDHATIDISSGTWAQYSSIFIASVDDSRPVFYADTDASNDINGISFDDVSLREVVGRIRPQIKNLLEPRPTNLSETGLQFATYGGRVGQTLVDISGTGNNGTITEATSKVDGTIILDGVNDKVVIGNVGNTKTVAFTIKLATTTEQILEGAANDKLTHASSGTLTYPEFDDAYINGVNTNTITTSWSTVVITSTTNVDMSAVTLALNNATYGAFEISNLQMYSTELTSTEAVAYHNSFANEVVVLENFDYPTASLEYTRNFQVVSGTFAIASDATGTYLSCSGNGSVKYGVDLSGFVGNGYLSNVDGDLSADEGGTVSASSNFAYSGGWLTITMTSGQKLYRFAITKGESL